MKYIMLTVLFILASGCVVLANPLATATYTQVDEGYRLNFTVTAGQYQVYSFGLYRADTTNLTMPSGWGGDVNFRETMWVATSPYYYIQSNETLAGFTCMIHEIPQQIDYFIGHMDPYGSYRSTLVPTPAPVPEPSSILALAGGLAGVGGFALRRRR